MTPEEKESRRTDLEAIVAYIKGLSNADCDSEPEVFMLSRGAYDELTSQLNEPGKESEKLRKLLATKPLWDQSKDAEPYRNDAWELSQRDSEIILDAMENPPPASQALVELFRDFKHTHTPDAAWDGDYTMEKE